MWRGSLDESLLNNGKKLNQTSPVLDKTLKKTSNALIVFQTGSTTELMRKIWAEK